MFRKLEQLALLLIPTLSIPTIGTYSSNINYQFAVLLVSQYLPILVPRAIPCLAAGLAVALAVKISQYRHSAGADKVDTRAVLDLARFLTITQTTICIFLCDFSFWDHRFSKNDGYTVGLMDLGVGCFMFCNGIVSSKARRVKLAKNAVLLFLLGLIRLLVVYALKLDVNPNEYGLHWNFYFTIAAVMLLFLVVGSSARYLPGNILSGAVLLIGYEIASPVISQIIFSPARTSLLMQNKEGLFSLIPFLGFYLVLNHLGRLLLERDMSKALKSLRAMWWANLRVYAVTQLYSTASRRLCNLAYLSWILVIMFSFLWLFMEIAFRYPQLIQNRQMLRTCSDRMFHIFLASNLLVLLFKICFDLKSQTYLSGNALNLIYLGLNFLGLPKVLKRQPRAVIKETSTAAHGNRCTPRVV